MTTAEDIQSILQREANAILNIPISDAFEKAISLIVEQVHRKKGKLEPVLNESSLIIVKSFTE
jgi:arabinose-5-phosphate isomerase